MYTNSTSFSVQPKAHSPIVDSPAASLLSLLYLVTQLPVMRSREGHSLPDQPDRAGMRERRDQRKITLSELKQIRRVEEGKHAQLPSVESYETPRLVTHKKKGTGKDVSFSSLVGDTNFLQIGPSGAEAAVTATGKTSNSRKFSVDEFVQKHSKNFEIWVSPSVRAAKSATDGATKSANGIIFVFGEMHGDPEITRAFTKLASELRRTSPQAKLFVEGDSDDQCAVISKGYGLSGEDCHTLENGSKEFKKLISLINESLRQIKVIDVFVRKELGLAPDPSFKDLSYPDKIAKFLEQVTPQLSDRALEQLEPLHDRYMLAHRQAWSYKDEVGPIRDQQMASKLRDLRSTDGINLVLTGAGHLVGIREHLRDLPCIFIKPRQITQVILKETPTQEADQQAKVDL